MALPAQDTRLGSSTIDPVFLLKLETAAIVYSER